MPGKRSNRSKVQHFFCPYCVERLWRLGSSKYHLRLPSPNNAPPKLKNKPNGAGGSVEQMTGIDPNKWLEAFFCSEHGKLWMLVRKIDDRNLLAASLASKADWQRSTGTPLMDSVNSSVSEFTMRMSRRADVRLRHPKN
jgi:hypothetical protein